MNLICIKINLKAEQISSLILTQWQKQPGNGPLTTANLILPVLASFFVGITLIVQTTDNVIFPSVSGRK